MEKLKLDLIKFRNNTYWIVYWGLVFGISKATIRKKTSAELTKLVNEYKLSKEEIILMRKQQLYFIDNLIKLTFLALIGLKLVKGSKDYKEVLEKRSTEVFSKVPKVPDTIKSYSTIIIRQEEKRKKEEHINRALELGGVFFICSAHVNPRKEHEPLEGRVYYNWDKMGFDPRVARLVKKYKMLTVQEAVGDPYYLITSPNCKHYFIPVSIDEVAKGNHKQLLKDKNGYMKDQTPEPPAAKILRGYKQEKELLEGFKKISSNPTLEKRIRKLDQLIKKWSILQTV